VGLVAHEAGAYIVQRAEGDAFQVADDDVDQLGAG
jgi:hypothetical protein